MILSPCRSDSFAEKEAAILNVNVTVQIIKKLLRIYMMPGTRMIGMSDLPRPRSEGSARGSCVTKEECRLGLCSKRPKPRANISLDFAQTGPPAGSEDSSLATTPTGALG